MACLISAMTNGECFKAVIQSPSFLVLHYPGEAESGKIYKPHLTQISYQLALPFTYYKLCVLLIRKVVPLFCSILQVLKLFLLIISLYPYKTPGRMIDHRVIISM